MKKYDAVTRERVWGTISTLMGQGLPSPVIGEQMRKQGFKMPDGKTDITDQYVGHTMGYLHKKAKGLIVNGKPASRQAHKTDRLPATVVGILTDPHLSADQKIRMITAYADL